MIFYLTLEDRWMFSEYLDHWGRELAGTDVRILRYEHLLNQTHFAPGTYVFSTIEEVSAPIARYIDALAAALRDRDGFLIINDPALVLRRHELHRELHGRGMNRFRSFRATADLDDLRYPVFVRSECAHDGALSPLLNDRAEVDVWIGRAMALGRPLHDLLVVEFCDTSDAGGWYRKYAAFNVNGTIVPRSLNYGRKWMMKFAGNEYSIEMAREELDYVENNPHRDQIAEIFAIAKTGYGRIDYSILDGRVQTWEINLNPTVGRGRRPSRREHSEEIRELREAAKQSFYRQFNSAWKVLAAASPHGAETEEIRIDRAIVDAARTSVRTSWRTRRALIATGISIVKPLMKTPARPLFRALYHLPGRIVRGFGAPLFGALARRALRRQERGETSSRA